MPKTPKRKTGTCPACLSKNVELYCGRCQVCRREYAAEYYKKNRKKVIAKVEAYRKKHPEKHLARRRERTRKLRMEVVKAYGGKCECCGDKNIEFLAIDHEFGNGRKHRLAVAGLGSAFYSWLKRHKFPKNEGLRLMCHNCNQSLGLYGYCPHHTESKFV